MTNTLVLAENETGELKKSLAELKQGLISLVAMLNKHGQAELWFGIAPNGKAVGLEINEKTLRDVSQAIAAHIEPTIYPQISQQLIEGKQCLHIKAEGWQRAGSSLIWPMAVLICEWQMKIKNSAPAN